LWSRLADSHLNENHYENHNAIAEQIVKTFNNPEFIEKIASTVEQQTKVFREATADYSMCLMLNLKWDQYVGMIDHFIKKTAHSYTESGLEELKIRKQILAQTKRYKVAAQKDKNVPIDEIVEGMSFSYIVNYLNEATKKEDFATKIIRGKSLTLIRNYFKAIDGLHVEPEGDFTLEIELIEEMWDIGMRLFFKEDGHDF
jgi:hypothetical protein